MSNLPSGTVTFMFTDLAGSAKRWNENPGVFHSARVRHETSLRQAIENNGGYAYKVIGDTFRVAFPTALQAAVAALDAQRAMHAEQWPPELGEFRVRVALHTGVTDLREGEYVGPLLNRVARLLASGHGGQVLLTEATASLLREGLPADVTLRDLGEHRLRDLVRPERIYQLSAPYLPSEFPPLKTLEGYANNLPLQPTPLIGREDVLAGLRDTLCRDDVWLVTLTGTGGIGKTRLALQMAADLLDEFEDGAFFVNLAPLNSPALVIPTIAEILSVREAGGEPLLNTLRGYLRDRHMLLVLDNFEHVADAATQVAELVSASSKLKVLVTSRVPLHLYDEREFPVGPLDLPPAETGHTQLLTVERLTQYEAVRLFIERAVQVKPDFEVNNENAPAIAEICVRLDGLPLAIELAAARVKVLSPQLMLTRLESRLKLLTGGARDLPERQQTLRNTIAWSYELLEADEITLFRRLAVFRGGCTLEDIEAVCNTGDGVREWGEGAGASKDVAPYSLTPLTIDILDATESLVSKNLLRQREGAGGEPRLLMLETIQEFAREKLEESGEKDALREAHAHYFLQLAEEGETQLKGSGQAQWLEKLADEHDNMRAALLWAEEKGAMGHSEAAQVGLCMAGALWRFWNVRGHQTEGREHLDRLLSITENREWGEGIGTSKGATPHSLNPPELDSARAKAFHGAGTLAWVQGDHTAGRSHFEESSALWRKLENRRGLAESLSSLGAMTVEQGDYTDARLLFEESLKTFRERDDKRGMAIALGNLGVVAWYLKDYPASRQYYEGALDLFRQLDHKKGIAATLGNLGDLAQEQGDYASAGPLHKESLTMFGELGDKIGIIKCLENLARLAVSQAVESETQSATSLAEHTVRLWGAAEVIREEIGSPRPPSDVETYGRSVAAAQALMSAEVWEKTWAEGRAMDAEQAIDYALGMDFTAET